MKRKYIKPIITKIKTNLVKSNYAQLTRENSLDTYTRITWKPKYEELDAPIRSPLPTRYL